MTICPECYRPCKALCECHGGPHYVEPIPPPTEEPIRKTIYKKPLLKWKWFGQEYALYYGK